MELADLWETLRSLVDKVPTSVSVTVKVQRPMLAKFLILHSADLTAPPPQEPADAENTDPIKLEVRFNSLGSAEQLLLFGPGVEVLEPAELRDALVRKAKETIALYSGTQNPDSGHRPDSSAASAASTSYPAACGPGRQPGL